MGIGLFLTFIGLNQIGFVALGIPGAPVSLGTRSSPSTLLAIVRLMTIAWLLAKCVNGARIAGILVTTILSFATGITPVPAQLVSMPPGLAPIIGQMDIAGAWTLKALPVVMIVFVTAFVDTIGPLIGLSARAGLFDEHGNLPAIEKPMLTDAMANLVTPFVGTTTSGAFVESAAGIEEGCRTGFTALVVAVLFLSSLFLATLLTAIPPHAHGIAPVAIRILMVSPSTKLDFTDHTELIPAFLTIVPISFTYNIGVGMSAGLLVYRVRKVITGRGREVPPPLWLLPAMSLVFFVVSPYR